MRRVLLMLVVVAGLGLVVWSGYRNLHARREQSRMQTAVQTVVAPGSSDSTSDSLAASPLKGKRAPAFTLADLSGKKVSLSDFKGHPLVVNFWGTYCGPCKFEMPWLEEFSHKYADSGLKVVGITYDAEVGVPTISKDVRELGVTYPILLSNAKAEDDYLKNTEALPMSFYVDKTGKIIEVTAGTGSKDQLEAMVKETVNAVGAQ
jgi:thiol-disulfide isomerase/thioredoxin